MYEVWDENMPPAVYRRHTLWTICLCGLTMHLTDGKRDVRELPLKLVATEHYNGIVDLVYEKR